MYAYDGQRFETLVLYRTAIFTARRSVCVGRSVWRRKTALKRNKTKQTGTGCGTSMVCFCLLERGFCMAWRCVLYKAGRMACVRNEHSGEWGGEA